MSPTAVMVRAAVFPLEMLEGFCDDPTLATQHLRELSANPAWMEALWIASPTLGREVEDFADQPGQYSNDRIKRLLISVARYLLRATTRCTPFGLFAGVRAVPIGETTEFRLGDLESHRKRLRVDAKQVYSLVQRLERTQALEDAITYFANPALYRWGERLCLPYRDGYGQESPSERLTIRFTDSVARILELTRKPVSRANLIHALRDFYPDAEVAAIRRFLQKLGDEQVLLSTLRPPITATDPLAYVINQLPPGSSSELPEQAKAWQAKVQAYNVTPMGQGCPTLRTLFDDLSFQAGQAQKHLQVDLHLAGSGTFSAQEVRELRGGIEALASLFPPRKPLHLEAYAKEFLERYGHREVPVLEVLDPEFGLGSPASYLHPKSLRPSSDHGTPLPTRVYAMLYQAERNGLTEIDLQQLDFPASKDPATLPASVDCFVQRVPGPANETWLVLDGLHTPGGATFGRFSHLDEELKAHLQAKASEHPEEILLSDLVYGDRYGHANNVAIHPPLYAFETCVATTPGVDFEQHIPLSDILVGVREGRFFFRSLERGAQVLFRVPHVLNPLLAPNPVRFLQEACLANEPMAPRWDWGPLAEIEALPRVRFGRVVLAPARWRVAENVSQSAAEHWEARFAEFRERVQLPRYVSAGVGDNRLILDLDRDLHRLVLRDILRHESPVIEEAIGGYAAADVRDAEGGHHFAQYILSLPLGDASIVRAPARMTYSEVQVSERQLLPLQECTYLKLYGAAGFQNDVIECLRAKLMEHGAGDHSHWFFIRYADPEPHVRFRVFGDRLGLPGVTLALLQAAEELRRQGVLTKVVLDTYEREIERYGGLDALRACERIFSVDSEAIHFLQEGSWLSREHRLATVAVTADSLLLALGLSPEQRLAVLRAACQGYRQEFGSTKEARDAVEAELSKDFRQQRAAAVERLRIAHAPSELAVDERLSSIFREFRAGIGEWAPPLRAALDPESLETRPHLLTSLLHMHANRAGLDRWLEFRALHLMLKMHQSLANYWPVGIDRYSFEPHERSLA